MTTSTKRIRLDPDPKAEVQEESDQDINKLIAENNQLKSQLSTLNSKYQILQNTVTELAQAENILPKHEEEIDEKEEEIANAKNPLLNTVVIKNLMRYVASCDLNNCRLVCKLWRDEASPHVLRRREIIINLGDYDSCQDFCHLIETAPLFSKFQRVKFVPFHPKPTPSHSTIQRVKHKIFSMIGDSLKHLNWFVGPNLIHESNLREYFSCCTNLESLSWSMYNLKLNSTLIPNNQQEPDAAPIACEATTLPISLLKLKKFQILPPPSKATTFENSGSYFITNDIFRMAPNLEEINCDLHQTNLPIDLDNGLGFLIKPLCLNRPANLTKLFLQEIVTDFEIIRLTNAGFHLKSLCLINTSYHVQRFLISLKDTLEELTLVMHSAQDIPVVKSLTKLKHFASPLLFFNAEQDHSLYENRNSVENPPNVQELISLKFKADDQGYTEQLLTPFPNTSLREFGLFHFQEPTLRRIISNCPNISKMDLVLHCSPNIPLNKLHCVWSVCENLHELNLRFAIDTGNFLNNVQAVASGNLNLDSEFTGYNFEQCRNLRPHAIFCPNDCDCLTHLVRPKPSITNLTKLERLEIMCTNGTFVTDLTIRECLMKMNSLTYIHLHNALLGPSTVHKLREAKSPSTCVVVTCDNEFEDNLLGEDDDDDDDY